MGNSILHLAAIAGGVRTLDILLAARPGGLEPDALNRQGKTAMVLAQERRDRSEQFLDKLQGLCNGVRTQAAMEAHPPKAVHVEVANVVPEKQALISSRVSLLLLEARSLSYKSSTNITKWTLPGWPLSPFNWISTSSVLNKFSTRENTIQYTSIHMVIYLSHVGLWYPLRRAHLFTSSRPRFRKKGKSASRGEYAPGTS